MLNAFYEFFPVLLFFVAFKFYGIYVATVVGIVTTGVQVILSYFLQKKFDKKLLITFVVFLVFGGMTLYFHNPIFVKWKPTIIFWIFAIAFLFTQWIGEKTLIQRFFSKALEEHKPIPYFVWKRLNLGWALFFATLGAINLFVAYRFTDNVWVDFKLYGITGLLLVFSLVQAIYLTRYMHETSRIKND